ERRHLGEGDTGYTTAHLTCVTDVRLQDLARDYGREQAALSWYAGNAALDLIEQIVTDHDIACEFHRTPGFLHAPIEGEHDDISELKAEFEIARELGFDVEFVDHVPVVDKPGIEIRDQAKFHPRKYLAALARLVD